MLRGRRLYVAVAAIYALTRAALYLLGVRFGAGYDWQHFHDPDLLEHRLWESLLYTHAFTPFMNLLAGTALKISHAHAPALYHALYSALGLAFVLALAYAMDAVRLRRPIIVGAVALFACSPAFVYLEHLLHYEFPAAALLAVAGALLYRALTHSGWLPWFLFFTTCALLTYVRTTFHLIWLVAVLALALFFEPRRRGVVLATAAIPLLLVVALYAKNLSLFGFFGTSSWAGFNLAFVTTQRMTPDERARAIADGLLHPIAAIPIYSGPEAYARYVELGAPRGIPVLDRLRRANGEPNYNHASYIEIARLRMRDDRAYLARYPGRYASTVLAGIVDYFRPSSRWHPHDPEGSPHAGNRAVIGRWEDGYNALFHRFPVAPVGVYPLLLLALASATWSAAAALWRGYGGAREKLLLFMSFNCGYVPALSCLVTIGELERYRFMVEAFMWIVGLCALPRAWVRAARGEPASAARRVRSTASACLCAWLALSGAARAQEAIWPASPAQQLEPWFAKVRAALEDEDVVATDAEAAREGCDAERARMAAQRRGAALGACVEVERRARTAVVTIELARASDGAVATGSAESAAGDPAAAAREAYRRAELALELGRVGLVRVRSTPEGALVELDGSIAGHAPLERRVTPGRHQLALSLDGFAPEQRAVSVERGRAVDVAVRLRRAELPAPRARTEPSPLNYVVGGVLLAGAASALTLSLVALARDGDCAGERNAAGECDERVHFGTRSAVLLAIGGAALVAGAYLVLAAPLQVAATADDDGARIALRGRF